MLNYPVSLNKACCCEVCCCYMLVLEQIASASSKTLIFPNIIDPDTELPYTFTVGSTLQTWMIGTPTVCSAVKADLIARLGSGNVHDLRSVSPTCIGSCTTNRGYIPSIGPSPYTNLALTFAVSYSDWPTTFPFIHRLYKICEHSCILAEALSPAPNETYQGILIAQALLGTFTCNGAFTYDNDPAQIYTPIYNTPYIVFSINNYAIDVYSVAECFPCVLPSTGDAVINVFDSFGGACALTMSGACLLDVSLGSCLYTLHVDWADIFDNCDNNNSLDFDVFLDFGLTLTVSGGFIEARTANVSLSWDAAPYMRCLFMTIQNNSNEGCYCGSTGVDGGVPCTGGPLTLTFSKPISGLGFAVGGFNYGTVGDFYVHTNRGDADFQFITTSSASLDCGAGYVTINDPEQNITSVTIGFVSGEAFFIGGLGIKCPQLTLPAPHPGSIMGMLGLTYS